MASKKSARPTDVQVVEAGAAAAATAAPPGAPVAATPAKAPKSARSADRAGKAKSAAKAAAAPAAPQKTKLVRDSFTFPKDEYALLDAMKQRALGQQRPVKKAELLRAGIIALNAMSDRAFLKALSAVPTLKTGRPKGGESAQAAEAA